MKRKLLSVLAVILLVSSIALAGSKVSFAPNTDFKPGSVFVVLGQGVDPLGLDKALSYALINNGFQVAAPTGKADYTMVFTYSYTTVYGDYIKKVHVIIYDSANKAAATISYSSILGGSADGAAQSIVKSLVKKPNNNSDNNNEEDKA